MPGIAGVISEIGADACQHVVHSMISCMQFEAFYTSGTNFVPEMGIYAGWVAPEGSFAAKQVFTNPRKDILLLFAGEFFPGSKGESNSSRNGNSCRQGEGDWLIHAYEEEGEEFFEKLNGLFSGLLIDKRRKKAFLFNDRYGLERIYICEAKTGIYFASEAKALLRVLPELRAFDENGVAQFVTFGSTLNWQTLFRGVQLLPGGSIWSVGGGKLRKGSYFSSTTWESQAPLSEPEFECRFKETFKRVLPRYLDSGTDIGVSLTGGLDTRMITACLPSLKVKPLCYTFTGQEPTILDSRLAAQIASVCGMQHRNLKIGPDFFADFDSLADKTVYITDGCFGVLGAHELYFNRKAREVAPVRLTGNYGSEVLRGMSTFKPIGLSKGLLAEDLNQKADFLTAEVNRSSGHPVSFAAFKEIPWNLFGSLSAGRSQVTFRTPYLDNDVVALAFQAPESLRRSSTVALNLVKENNASLASIPTDRGRGGSARGATLVFKRLFCDVTFKLDYIYSEALPNLLAPFDPLIGRLDAIGILGLHKFLRYRRWLRKELANYLNDTMASVAVRQMPYWNRTFLERMGREHINGTRNYVREINAVLTLAAVERLLFH